MLTFVLLILALFGIVAGFVMSKKGDARGSAVMTVAAVIGLGAAMVHLFLRPGDGLEEHPIKVQEWHFASIAAERLGLHLTEKMPGAKALIVMPFDLRTSEPRRKAMLEGLVKGLGDKITVVKVADPPLPPTVRTAYESRINPDMEQQEVPDFSTWFTAAYFDRLLQEYPGDYNLVISLAGLPEDAQNMRCLTTGNKLKFAMAFGPLFKLHSLMKDGVLVADVQQHPAPNPQSEPPDEDIIASFDRRFLLVTPETMDELKQKYPDLF